VIEMEDGQLCASIVQSLSPSASERQPAASTISRMAQTPSEEAIISIAWDEQVIDPLGCLILLRTEGDGLPLLER